MVYHVIGLMSGSSMDGLDIAYCELTETGGQWQFQILQAACMPFDQEWTSMLPILTTLRGNDLMLLHTAFGKWMGNSVSAFIEQHQLQHSIHLIASHGHTVFHNPERQMTFQMGDGASIAAITGLPVISDLRNMDIALGGQGAPIIPIGEKKLWPEYQFFLNLGGIANISFNSNDSFTAFDVCAANRVLNLLAAEIGLVFDANGEQAANGNLHDELLHELNALSYYQRQPPKSLSNAFGVDTVYGILKTYHIATIDKLHTYCHHIAQQISNAAQAFSADAGSRMLITGGGAHNHFLVKLITAQLQLQHIETVVPDTQTIDYKEALVMAFIGTLRWREEVNVLSGVTGATRSSVGGALWMGHD